MILVTGATGHVGGEMAQQLVAAGKPVRVLVRRQDHPQLARGVESALGDLDDPASLSAALRGVEAVFLLATALGTPVLHIKMR
jgi:uncharacterized protein YbjT (DUF2867 family)